MTGPAVDGRIIDTALRLAANPRRASPTRPRTSAWRAPTVPRPTAPAEPSQVKREADDQRSLADAPDEAGGKEVARRRVKGSRNETEAALHASGENLTDGPHTIRQILTTIQ